MDDCGADCGGSRISAESSNGECHETRSNFSIFIESLIAQLSYGLTQPAPIRLGVIIHEPEFCLIGFASVLQNSVLVFGEDCSNALHCFRANCEAAAKKLR